MPRRLTHKEFLNKFYEKNEHAQDIEILEDYINSATKMKVKCKKCGYEWAVKPNDLLQGHGCLQCAHKRITQKRTKTQTKFIDELHKVNPNIIVLGDYINNRTKILCRCKKCQHEWETRPYDLLNGHGCAICARKRVSQNQTKTTQEFITKLKQINPNIEVLEDYIKAQTEIKCRCKKCEHQWKVKPYSLLQGHGCPKCSISKGEKRIAQYLDNLGINYIYDKRYFSDLISVNGGLMRPDFIIPSLKIWIEFDGQQHFEPVDFTSAMSEQQIQVNFKIVQQNDQKKNQYAKANNWTLIRIPYTEYDNIEQILDAYLKQEQVI